MPNPLAPVSDYMECKLWVDFRNGGWSEKYNLNTTSYATAKTQFSQIITARAPLLSSDFRIVHAVISKKNIKGDSVFPMNQALLPPPRKLDSESTVGVCNAPDTSLLIRFDSGVGKFGNRHIRGTRDTWVTDDLLQITPTAYAVGGPYLTYATPPTLDTSAHVLGNYLAIVRDLTCLFKQTAALTDPTPFTPYVFDFWQFQHVSAKDVGRRYSPSRGHQPAFA